MCNHYANIPEIRIELQTWREFIVWSMNVPVPSDGLDADVWPRRQAMVVRQDVAVGGAFADIMTWGVPLSLPGKRPGSKVTKYVTNVRNLESPFWRNMLAKPEQRCLVPFSRFAEPKAGAGREEHWFAVNDRPLAAFAGIWRWQEPSMQAGLALDDDAFKPSKVFAFLTCEPNPLVAPLHPKAMPVILHESDYQCWLSGSLEEATKLVVPFPSQLMRLVNDPHSGNNKLPSP
jgi:putative SOS response-associated peptidase YedK